MSNSIQVVLVSAALLCAFGPHLLMLGYKAAGARPPGALSFFCLLQHGNGSANKPAVVAGWSIPGAKQR